MFKPLAASMLIASTIAGCVSTTTTCTLGDLCWTSEPPPPSTESDDDDAAVAMITVGAVVTAIALVAVLRHRNEEAPPSRGAPVAQPVAYVVPPGATDDEIRLQRMYIQGHLSARAGRCDAVIAIGNQMALKSPSYHERYAADPTIAVCLR